MFDLSKLVIVIAVTVVTVVIVVIVVVMVETAVKFVNSVTVEYEFSGEDEKVCAEFGLLLEVNCEVVVVEKEFWLVLIKDEVCCC